MKLKETWFYSAKHYFDTAKLFNDSILDDKLYNTSLLPIVKYRNPILCVRKLLTIWSMLTFQPYTAVALHLKINILVAELFNSTPNCHSSFIFYPHPYTYTLNPEIALLHSNDLYCFIYLNIYIFENLHILNCIFIINLYINIFIFL